MNSIEFMLYLPIVLIILLAIVQFSKVLSVEARLAGASREGARVAASGGDSAQISAAVHAGLSKGERELVAIETNAVDSKGKPASLPCGESIVVRVSMPTTKAVPSPLCMLISNQHELVGQTVMRKE